MNQTYYFIVNSRARTGKGILIWNRLEEILKEKQVRYKAYRTAHEGHAKSLASKITSIDENRVIVIVGGDGTVNEVINGVRDFSRVKFGYIPIGSANDLARGLGILGQSQEEILHRILEGNCSFAMDLGRVTGERGFSQLFAISSGIGIDAEVSKAALTSKLKKILNVVHLGALTYKFLTVAKLISMPHVESVITLDNQKPRAIKKGIFAVGMNQPAEGGGVTMAPKADCRDGELTLCAVHGYSKYAACYMLPVLLMQKHEGHRGFWIENFKRAKIELAEPMVLHADGEYCGEHKVITLECLEGHMKFIQ